LFCYLRQSEYALIGRFLLRRRGRHGQASAPVTEVRLAVFGSSHLTSLLCNDQQPPPLDGLAPIYDYLHRRLKECFDLSFNSILGSLAAISASHLVSLYLQSPPSALLRLFALYCASETAQGDASVL